MKKEVKNLTYYNRFDELITEMSQDNVSDDFFYDIGVIDATQILSKFDCNDWRKLEKNIVGKNDEWKKKAIYCFEGEFPEELLVVLAAIDTDNMELFEVCVDSLRLMINENNKSMILENTKFIQKLKEEADNKNAISCKALYECVLKLNLTADSRL